MFFGAIVVVILIVPFMVLPRELRNPEMSPYSAVIRSVVVTMAAAAVLFALAKATGHPLYDTCHRTIEEVSKILASDDSYKRMLGISGLSQSEALGVLVKAYETMARRIPAYIFTVSMLYSYFVYTRLSRSVNKHTAGNTAQLMPKFKEFSLPQNSIAPLVIFYFVALLLGRSEVAYGAVIYQSINYLFDVAFVLQGASVLFMMCDARKWPKAVAFALVLIFWNFYILRQALVILGMFDLIIGMKARVILKAQMREQTKREKKRRR